MSATLVDLPKSGIPLHRILPVATICMLSPYIHCQSLRISDHAHIPSLQSQSTAPPQELVENVQWYAQHRVFGEAELNGTDERLVDQLIAEINTNPTDGETITLEVTNLAEDHSYCTQNHISCKHCTPCIHTHQSVSAYMCPSMWLHHQPGVAMQPEQPDVSTRPGTARPREDAGRDG